MEIWTINLEDYWDKQSVFFEFLDNNEKEKARRFKFDYLKRNFILAHGLMRYLASLYLKLHPSEIEFKCGIYGKPFLFNHPLHFNMSHSHNMVLYAFSKKIEMGVDIEYVNPELSVNELTLSLFPKEISSEIMLLPPEKKRKRFYKEWTQFEAYLKYTGVGLSNELKTILSNDYKCCSFFDVPLSNDYVGSVVYQPSDSITVKLMNSNDIDISPIKF